VDIALHFEDAAPAAVLDEHAGEQNDGDKATGEGEERDQAVPDAFERRLRILSAIDVGPDCLFKSFVGLTVLALEMREEVKLGVACDLRMSRKECGELRIITRDIVLVGEERRIVGDNCGKCGAEAKESDELALRGSDVAIVGNG